MNTKSLIVGENLASNFSMFPQEAESKYKNITTGYGVDDTSKGKNMFLDDVPGQREFANLSAFQFL